jgi:hypothetical protein
VAVAGAIRASTGCPCRPAGQRDADDSGSHGPVATVGHASDAIVMAAVIGSTDKFDKPDIVASDRSRTRGRAKRAGTMGRIGHTINSRHGSCLGRLPACLVLAATLKPATAGRRPGQAWAADLASCS